MSDDLKEWKCLYNFHTSPFHPSLKAVINCIWAHRSWGDPTDTVKDSAPSQATIGDECGFGRSTVKKYATIAERLGLFTSEVIGATEFCKAFPLLAKYAKACHRYTVYHFDLTAPIWQQKWTREELVELDEEAVSGSDCRHRRRVRLDAKGRLAGSNGSSVSAANGSSVSAVQHSNGSPVSAVNGSPVSAETFLGLSSVAGCAVVTSENLSRCRSRATLEEKGGGSYDLAAIRAGIRASIKRREE